MRRSCPCPTVLALERRKVGVMKVRTQLAIGAVVLVGVGLSAMPAGAATSTQNKFVKAVRFLDPDAAAVSNKTIITWATACVRT